MPEAITIVVPSLEPAAAEEQQASTGRHVEWLRAAAMITTIGMSYALHLHRMKNVTSKTTTTTSTTSNVRLRTFRSEPRNVRDQNVTFFTVRVVESWFRCFPIRGWSTRHV